MATRIKGDFNGLEGELLCLSHTDFATTDSNVTVTLEVGMTVVAFEPDVEDGQTCFLVASGRVAPSPEWMACRGSRWCLQIDSRGARHVVDLDDA